MIKQAISTGHALAFDSKYTTVVMTLIFMAEIIVNTFIVKKVPYTEIDWKAYMSEVEGYLNGSTNYYDLKGDTGPLVYPGGFVYLFSILYYVTDHGANIARAQIIFAAFYLIHLGTVFTLYQKVKLKMPPILLLFMSLSGYRIHSIFSLRLFNDGPAMTLFYLSVLCFVSQNWKLGSLLYSLSVSVKMNTLLAAPGLLVIYLRNLNLQHTILNLAICASVQVVAGFEFLTTYPVAYLHRSFNLGRQFEYKWTVNWRFISEELFLDRRLHLFLLATHLILLALIFHRSWSRSQSSFVQKVICLVTQAGTRPTSSIELVSIIFASNFIGICCARSLHYQFYVWYYHTLPFLFHHTAKTSLPVSILCLLCIEYAWNVYPSTVFSSVLLLSVHIFALIRIFIAVPPTAPLRKVD